MNPAPLCPPPTHLQALLIVMSGNEENWSNRVEKKERTQELLQAPLPPVPMELTRNFVAKKHLGFWK